MKLFGRDMCRDLPPLVIAELSGNHNGDLNRALKLVELAKQSGADAIKLQTYTADTMTIDCQKSGFTINGGLWDGRTLYELYEEAHTPWDWHEEIFQAAKRLELGVFSTPFDKTAVQFLENLHTSVYKVASFEIVDLPLLKVIAAFGKPMILSTGMANYEEIAAAVDTIQEAGNNQIVLLHCVSGYPTPVEEMNLKAILDLQNDFNVPVGLSDHSLGTEAAVASVALGACVIEKHFTISRSDGGPDAAFSLEPRELEQLCRQVRNAWMALGSGGYSRRQAEEANLQFRRSIYVVQDVRKGEVFTESNIRTIRPGFGLPPMEFDGLLGRAAGCDIERGSPLKWSMVDKTQ